LDEVGISKAGGQLTSRHVINFDDTPTVDVLVADNPAENRTDVSISVAPGYIPVGAIMPYAGIAGTEPYGWLLCNAPELDRVEYAELFAVVGEMYGAGDGVTTFLGPNLQGCVIVGVDPTQTEFEEPGIEGGVKEHTLTGDESGIQTHGHADTFTTGANSVGHTHASHTSGDVTRGSGALGAAAQQVAANTGANSASHTHAITGSVTAHAGASAISPHTNLQPFVAMNWIIRAFA
jgi:microcystin-dependent protein